MTFYQWLVKATDGLALDGIERIRAEIGEHYQSARASVCTPEQAIAGLGDPKAANRGYRKVFLTEDEAQMNAPRTQGQLIRLCLWYLVLIAAWLYFYRPSVST